MKKKNYFELPVSTDKSVWVRVNRRVVTIVVPHRNDRPSILRIRKSEWDEGVKRFRAETPYGDKVRIVHLKTIYWVCRNHCIPLC